MTESEYLAAIDHELKGVDHFSVGTTYLCDECNPDELDEDEDLNIYDEGSFSWRACDSCGSSLGGDRYAAHGDINGELTHFAVCVDCMIYHANGDLPNFDAITVGERGVW